MQMSDLSANARGAALGLTEHKFPWKWNLTDLAEVPKNGRKVFSCFSCGGGSSMGYKLAGYTVLGNCEIDPNMNAVYNANLHPEYSYLMDIRSFNNLEEYPSELKCLDILDGSPPCSVFSRAGGREKGWNKEKKFREGQKKQRLDDLFFHFIHTAELLKPKVIVAENVKGLIIGNAKGYVNEIIKAFEGISYTVQMFLLDAQTMGVPQRRERVFFIAHRNDIEVPKLRINIHEPVVRFGEVRSEHGVPQTAPLIKRLVEKRRKGDYCLGDISKRERGKWSMFSHMINSDDCVASTNTCSSTFTRFCDGEIYSKEDFMNTQTFPQDYDFGKEKPQYVCGMSVPPVMMAQISTQIYEQWLRQ